MFKTGTSTVVPVANMLNTFPYKNRTEGQSPDAETLAGQRIIESFATRGGRMHNCMTGCIVQCSNVVHDAEGKYKTSALEFETITLLGANCAIKSWEDVADLDRLCDEVGLDTIETGAAIAVYMDSGGMEWGDAEGAKGLLKQIAEGTELGKAIGNGAVAIGKKRKHHRVPDRARPGRARVGPASAQGDRRHLLHEPDGRRPHGGPDREPGLPQESGRAPRRRRRW
jgi:aldehyde:ferredoxin oxidoreductase